MGDRNLSSEFIIAFEKLKNITNNNPQTFVTFYHERDDFKEVRSAIVTHFDLRDRFVTSVKKIHGPISDTYINALREYKTRWDAAFYFLTYRESFYLFKDFYDEDSPVSFSEFRKTFRSKRLTIELTAPDPLIDTEFVPAWHHGWHAIELLLDLGRAQCVDGDDDIFSRIEEIADGALKFLEEDIGIDIREIFSKYHEIPNFFVPTHVSNKHGLTARVGLYGQLNDAIRAYVAGAPSASIAMCRSILETILKDHYIQSNERDIRLSDLIVMADEKYDFIQRNLLDKIRIEGNTIMHNIQKRGNLMRSEEKAILDFFKTLSFLIERAPKNKHSQS